MQKTLSLRAGITLCIIFTLCTILCITSGAGPRFNWYCKRTTDHSQPPIDADVEWITRYNGFYVDKKHTDHNQDKVIYLTFDAGYENGNVEKILDVMQKHSVKGSFFILGNLIERNPELVVRMADEGHLVCNHTYSHKDITHLSEEQLQSELCKLEQAYTNLTGKPMSKYFRPPEGTFDERSLNIVAKQGYKTVFWSFAYADWDNQQQMPLEAAKKKILDNLHNGEIMLLHPTSETNAAILSDVIGVLKSQGYRFATIDEIQKGEA